MSALAGDPATTALVRAQATARTMAAELNRLADGTEAAAWPTGHTSGWQGAAAESAAHLLAVRSEQFRTVAALARQASAAFTRHAEALEPVVALKRQTDQVPTELAATWQRRADDLAAASARQTADVLLALANSAPPPASVWSRRLEQVDAWRGEVQLGTAEAAEALVNVVGQVGARLMHPFDRRAPEEAKQLRTAALEAARHPLTVVKSAVDWDTWRTNPARAAGHLVPDLVAAAASGGTAGAAKAMTVAGRTRAAIESAAVRDRLRREATGAAASASRQALVRRAQAVPAVADGWIGPGGTRLTPLQNASAEAFHALSAADEPTVTAAMRAAVAGRGRLAGLDQRLKPAESYKQKLATAHARTGKPLPDLLAGAKDAMRYTAVLDDANYVRGVADIANALERHGFHAQSSHNAWHGPRYRGINSHWLDPVTGAAFEVQFHTPASWRITKQTHAMYEEYRLPTTPATRRAELHDLIATEYRQAPIPGWVQTLTEDVFPPATRPDPITPPVDYTVHAAALGAGVAGLGTAAARIEVGTRSRDREGHSRTP